jgi:hypothetical protein
MAVQHCTSAATPSPVGLLYYYSTTVLSLLWCTACVRASARVCVCVCSCVCVLVRASAWLCLRSAGDDCFEVVHIRQNIPAAQPTAPLCAYPQTHRTDGSKTEPAEHSWRSLPHCRYSALVIRH